MSRVAANSVEKHFPIYETIPCDLQRSTSPEYVDCSRENDQVDYVDWFGVESGELMEYWSRLFRLLLIENIVCEVEVVLVSCGVWI